MNHSSDDIIQSIDATKDYLVYLYSLLKGEQTLYYRKLLNLIHKESVQSRLNIHNLSIR